MQCIEIFKSLLAGRDIGLIGNYDVQKSVLAQTAQRGGNSGQQLKFRSMRWRVRFAIAHQRAVDYAVAIQEYCAPLVSLADFQSAPGWNSRLFQAEVENSAVARVRKNRALTPPEQTRRGDRSRSPLRRKLLQNRV